MPITTTPSERIGRCTRMRRFFVRFNRPESFAHTRSSAGFTVITSGFEFSVHTASPANSGWRMTSCGRDEGMDWFERLTGFRESNYADTRAKIKVEGRELQSLVNGKSYGIGELELVSLQSLRERAVSLGGPAGRLKLEAVSGDVRRMHRLPANAGALFQ